MVRWYSSGRPTMRRLLFVIREDWHDAAARIPAPGVTCRVCSAPMHATNYCGIEVLARGGPAPVCASCAYLHAPRLMGLLERETWAEDHEDARAVLRELGQVPA